MELTEKNRVVLKSYTVRIPESLLTNLQEARDVRADVTGKNVLLSDVFRDCLDYGLSVYREETNHCKTLQSVTPVTRNVNGKTKQLAMLAAELVALGLAALDQSPIPSESA